MFVNMKCIFLFTKYINFIFLYFIASVACHVKSSDLEFSHRSLLNKSDTRKEINFKVPDSPLLLLDRLQDSSVEFPPTPIARKESDNETSSSLCSCSLGICKCCTGYVMNLFNQKACMQVTYNPGDFAFDVAMTLNNKILYENTLSGKNPQPVCISPPRLKNLKLCGKFYNVFFPGRNLHFCLAMYGQWQQLELFNMAFDCMRMGAQGIAMVKPEDGGALPIANPLGGVDAVVDAGEDDIEDYDENLVRSLFNIFD